MAGGDQISPNLLTVDPVTGAVGANFTGKVHATEFDLDAGAGIVNAQQSIRWLSAGAGGAMVADVVAYTDVAPTPGAWRSSIDNVAVSANRAAFAKLRALDSVNSQFGAELDCIANPEGGVSPAQQVQVTVDNELPTRAAPTGVEQRTIVDSLGQSDFLQVTPRAKRTMTAGKDARLTGSTVDGAGSDFFYVPERRTVQGGTGVNPATFRTTATGVNDVGLPSYTATLNGDELLCIWCEALAWVDVAGSFGNLYFGTSPASCQLIWSFNGYTTAPVSTWYFSNGAGNATPTASPGAASIIAAPAGWFGNGFAANVPTTWKFYIGAGGGSPAFNIASFVAKVWPLRMA